MQTIRYSGLSRVESISELATVGETLFAKPSPLDMCCFLNDCNDQLLFENRRQRGSSIDESVFVDAKALLNKYMTQFIIPPDSCGEEAVDIMFAVADRDCVFWTYGALTWVIYAQILNLCSQRTTVPLSIKKQIFLTKVDVVDMNLKEVIDTLDSLSINIHNLKSTVIEFKELLNTLEYRAAKIVCKKEVSFATIQELASFFIYFKRTVYLRDMWPPLRQWAVPLESHKGNMVKIYEKYIDTKGFRKKILRMYYALATRHHDKVRSSGAHTAESRLKETRGVRWNNSVQNDAYRLSVEELIVDVNFKIAICFNAVDMFMKSHYEIPWIQYFCFFSENIVEQKTKLRASKYPLICISDFGTSIYYKGCKSPVRDVAECVFNWFYIIEAFHNNLIFKNIIIAPPWK